MSNTTYYTHLLVALMKTIQTDDIIFENGHDKTCYANFNNIHKIGVPITAAIPNNP